MLIYLAISAVLVFVTAFLLLLSGDTPFLALVHLVFGLGILPLIFAAIAYFIPVLTRSAQAHPAVRLSPVLLQITGFSVFLYFHGGILGNFGKGALYGAAGGALGVTLIFSGWLIIRARRTLGQPYPGWAWYLAAVVMLAAALAVVLAMAVWPNAYPELRLLHLHLNTLGFVGLTAIGTLQVLLPTVLGRPDAGAASRLRSDLLPYVGAVLAIGIGAGFSLPLALAGASGLLLVGLRLGLGWMRRYGWHALLGNGASAALGAALLGFLLLILFGVLHALKMLSGQDAVLAFMALFLLPLLTGALSQLLPVWRWPGPQRAAQLQMRSALAVGGGVRALLFMLGGVALALGSPQGLWLVAAGLLLFVVRLLKSFFPAGELR